MGQEIVCRASFNGQTGDGRAHLDTDHLLFRGDFRVKLPFKEMTRVASEDGHLVIEVPTGTAVFQMGPQAEKWAQRILNPPSLLDKLGVKTGMRVSVLGVIDEKLIASLCERDAEVSAEKPSVDSDLLLVQMDQSADLASLGEMQRFIKRNGAIWIVYPKGVTAITEGQVMSGAKSAGLVDVKIASFSPTHTALKVVIPVDRR